KPAPCPCPGNRGTANPFPDPGQRRRPPESLPVPGRKSRRGFSPPGSTATSVRQSSAPGACTGTCPTLAHRSNPGNDDALHPLGGPSFSLRLDQPAWIASPSTASAASPKTSDKVGWGWMVWLISHGVASSSLANPASEIRSV